MKKKNKIRKWKKREIESKKGTFKELIIKDLKILGIILFVAIVIFIVNLVNSVILFSPANNKIIYDRSPEFDWGGRYEYYKFYLSSDSNFENLIISKDVYGVDYELNKDLEFGTYYWKVVAINNGREITSAVYKFRIESVVATEINETLKNVGNTKVDVETLDNAGRITGSAILDINQEIEANNDTLYKVKQHE